MPYHILRKYYKQLADHGYINYADDFRKHVHKGLHRIIKETGEFKAYQDKISYIDRGIMGKMWVNIPSFSLEEINTPPDLPSEWWRKEE